MGLAFKGKKWALDAKISITGKIAPSWWPHFSITEKRILERLALFWASESNIYACRMLYVRQIQATQARTFTWVFLYHLLLTGSHFNSIHSHLITGRKGFSFQVSYFWGFLPIFYCSTVTYLVVNQNFWDKFSKWKSIQEL